MTYIYIYPRENPLKYNYLIQVISDFVLVVESNTELPFFTKFMVVDQCNYLIFLPVLYTPAKEAFI
jgi:hypothetical protein